MRWPSPSAPRSAPPWAAGATSISAGGKTFIVVGLPGILLALPVRLTVKEPLRGMADGVGATRRPGDQDARDDRGARFLWSRRRSAI